MKISDLDEIEQHLERQRRRGQEARDLLAHPLLQEVFAEMEKMLQEKALACDADNKDMAWRVVLTQKLYKQMKDGIQIFVQRGDDAALQLKDLEKKRSVMDRVFQR